MIECIFTVDYEIYGNGSGSLQDLVYKPAEKLKELFQAAHVPCVIFVEAAELELIESRGADSAIGLVKEQLQQFHRGGFEIGLHLHPQWYNGRFENGRWILDNSEYNLCTLPRERIEAIVDRSISHLCRILGVTGYVPLAFRAGNWLFQPARTVARVLASRGIRVDSSVFKGGVRHEQGLDYRPALGNGHYWKFTDDSGTSDPEGVLTEMPIYTRMVPFWRMLNAKRIGMEQKGSSGQTVAQRVSRILDLLRFRHPLKLDFCRMTISEMVRMIDSAIKEDEKSPSVFRPVVAIGHTKELSDWMTVKAFLAFLGEKGIPVSTFRGSYPKCA
jgi:hypothetical protein